MKPIKLNQYAADSAQIYAEALLEACAKAKITSPKRALVDTDEFPKLLKMPTVEFAIGWLHGCAESHGVTVEVLWDHVVEPRKQVRKLAREWGRPETAVSMKPIFVDRVAVRAIHYVLALLIAAVEYAQLRWVARDF